MHQIDVYLDVVSPYAHLAFERLPEALAGLSFDVRYRPVLLAGLLQHWGQKGPAEIGPKRAWTYRHVAWLAERHGIECRLPASHPFNPLPLLRLAWATAAPGGTPNRLTCELLLRHVWRGGEAADDADRLAALEARLALPEDPRGEAVKRRLREETEAAAARGAFGVPTFVAGGRAFWGFDALEMLAGSLRGDAWFDGPAWSDAEHWPVGVQRRS